MLVSPLLYKKKKGKEKNSSCTYVNILRRTVNGIGTTSSMKRDISATRSTKTWLSIISKSIIVIMAIISTDLLGRSDEIRSKGMIETYESIIKRHFDGLLRWKCSFLLVFIARAGGRVGSTVVWLVVQEQQECLNALSRENWWFQDVWAVLNYAKWIVVYRIR